jgi:predicted porin
MNKLIGGAMALGAGLCCGTTMAQTVVYGLVDVGVEYVTNVNAAKSSAVRMPSLTGSFPSRIGFKGNEDLGGGLQVGYVLETGFGPDTGSVGQGGRLFGRQANVSIKNSYGTLTLGRQINMSYVSMLKADVMGPGIYAIGSMDGYLPNARSDNAVGYMGAFNGVSMGATYSVGRDASAAGGPAATNCAGEVAGNAKACRQVTALLAYDSTAYGAALSYDILYGGPGAAGGLTSSAFHDERTIVNGYGLVGATKFGGGLVARRTRAAVGTDSTLYFFGASYPASSSVVLDAQVARLKVKNNDKASTLITAKATYALSKRTALYATVGTMRNDGAAAIAVDAGGSTAAGLTSTGIMTGLRHTF